MYERLRCVYSSCDQAYVHQPRSRPRRRSPFGARNEEDDGHCPCGAPRCRTARAAGEPGQVRLRGPARRAASTSCASRGLNAGSARARTSDDGTRRHERLDEPAPKHPDVARDFGDLLRRGRIATCDLVKLELLRMTQDAGRNSSRRRYELDELSSAPIAPPRLEASDRRHGIIRGARPLAPSAGCVSGPARCGSRRARRVWPCSITTATSS